MAASLTSSQAASSTPAADGSGIFEEFKGTGNMELTLDRQLAHQRIWPALNILNRAPEKKKNLLDPNR